MGLIMHFRVELHIIWMIEDNSIEEKKKKSKKNTWVFLLLTILEMNEHFEYCHRCYSCDDDNINVWLRNEKLAKGRGKDSYNVSTPWTLFMNLWNGNTKVQSGPLPSDLLQQDSISTIQSYPITIPSFLLTAINPAIARCASRALQVTLSYPLVCFSP